MPEQIAKLTYDDLQQFPEDHIRRELLDGELYVSPGPNTRHQMTVVEILTALYEYGEVHGGPSPRATT